MACNWQEWLEITKATKEKNIARGDIFRESDRAAVTEMRLALRLEHATQHRDELEALARRRLQSGVTHHEEGRPNSRHPAESGSGVSLYSRMSGRRQRQLERCWRLFHEVKLNGSMMQEA